MSAPDVAKLEEENVRLGAALGDSYSVLAKTKTALEQLQAEYDALKYELDWFKRQLFGQKSEKRLDLDDEAQLNLLAGLGVEKPPSRDDVPTETVSYERRAKVRDAAVAQSGLRFGPEVPVQTIEVTDPAIEAIPEAEREVIGEKVSYRLAQQPGSYVVLKYVRSVVKRRDTRAILTTAAPANVLERSAADVSFLAAMLVDKFCWHLPLYRQHQRLLDAGITLSRSTLVYWTSRAIDLLAPITDAQSAHVLASDVLAMDETSIKAGREAKGKMRKGWLWPVYGDADEVVFHYAPSRAHRHVHAFLGEYCGTLLSDGYEAYAAYAAQRPAEVTHALCWAHTRRGFERAKDSEPEAVAEALTLIGAMYAHEEQIRADALTGEDKRAYRQTHTRPVVETFWRWCREQCHRPEPAGEGVELRAGAPPGAGGVPRRPGGGDRYESSRKSATTDSARETELAVRFERGRCAARRHHPESAGDVPAARSRCLHLPSRRAPAHQRASGQPRHRTYPADVEIAVRR